MVLHYSSNILTVCSAAAAAAVPTTYRAALPPFISISFTD